MMSGQKSTTVYLAPLLLLLLAPSLSRGLYLQGTDLVKAGAAPVRGRRQEKGVSKTKSLAQKETALSKKVSSSRTEKAQMQQAEEHNDPVDAITGDGSDGDYVHDKSNPLD